MGLPTKAQQDQRAASALYLEAKQRGLDDIYAAYPVIPRSTANDGMIEEICATFLEVVVGEIAPTLAVFRSAVEADPSLLGRSGVYVEPVEKQKQKILYDIQNLLTNVMSELDLRSELGKLKFWTLPQLRARRQQIIERQRLAKMSSESIRKELKDGRPKQHRYHPFDLLEPGVTATEVKSALRSVYSETWMRRFGSAQLTDRLNGRS